MGALNVWMNCERVIWSLDQMSLSDLHEFAIALKSEIRCDEPGNYVSLPDRLRFQIAEGIMEYLGGLRD